MVDRGLDRRIVEVLLNHGELTLPRIAKILNSNVGTIDYHLGKLAKRGIIKVEKRKYGTRYSVNRGLISVSLRTSFQFTASLVLTIFGVFLIINRCFVLSSLFLIAPSVIGFIESAVKLRHEFRGKLESLLRDLEKS